MSAHEAQVGEVSMQELPQQAPATTPTCSAIPPWFVQPHVYHLPIEVEISRVCIHGKVGETSMNVLWKHMICFSINSYGKPNHKFPVRTKICCTNMFLAVSPQTHDTSVVSLSPVYMGRLVGEVSVQELPVTHSINTSSQLGQSLELSNSPPSSLLPYYRHKKDLVIGSKSKQQLIYKFKVYYGGIIISSRFIYTYTTEPLTLSKINT